MAEAIFRRGRKLAECFAKSLRNEQGIVTETFGSLWAIENSPLNGAGKSRHDLSLTSQSDDTSKARGTVFSLNSLKVLQKQFVIFRICGRLSGIAGRIDAGSAAKGVDLQAGIIGDDPSIVDPRDGDRLEGGVLLKSEAGLLDARSRFVERG